MCGIAGIVNFNSQGVSENLLHKMTDRLEHRGPDDFGYYNNNNESAQVKVGLGMRRLSIIDLDTGKQPIHNEDKTLWIVFNGEIYNYLELRQELSGKHSFYTRSDTEVIVHLYEEYGIRALEKLRGMFAFAIWDSKKQELFIARDRMGQKPLYYCKLNGNFYFSSEIKSLMASPDFLKDINISAINDYLTYQYIPTPQTIWKDVKALKPASYMLLKKDASFINKKYWNIDFRKKTELSYLQAKERLYATVKEATKLRMISDVPLGAFLSGGVDSSIIVAMMSQLNESKVKTFSVGFKDQEFSELNYARQVAEKYSTDHHEFIVEPEYIDILPKLVWQYDQPYADCSALPSYYVAKMTRQHVTVALNGDAGDENFAGYLRHKALKASEYFSGFMKYIPKSAIDRLLEAIPMNESVSARSFPRYLHRFVEPLKQKPSTRNLLWHAYFNNQQKDFIYSDYMKNECNNINSYNYLEEIFENAPADNIVERALFSDLNSYLPDDLLVKVDIACMANSLEGRSPFLDHKLIELAASFPVNWKMHGLRTKHILKDTFKDCFPAGIMNRKKQGFSIPLGSWFRGDLQNYLKEILLSKAACSRKYFNIKNVEYFIQEHIDGKKDHGYCLWALLMLELWHRVFVDGDMK